MLPHAQIPRGVSAEVASLIATRFSARYLDVTKTTRALAHLAGAKRSHRRGRGVEFDEVRQYTAGDDVRAIDWRVTARSGTPHTKLFHEERERPVLVALDLRRGMHFGSKNCFLKPAPEKFPMPSQSASKAILSNVAYADILSFVFGTNNLMC